MTKIPFLDPTKVGAFQDRIIVYPDAMEEKTSGGLYIPEDAKEPKKWGTVVLVGEDVNEPIEIGTRVKYGKHSGQELPFGGYKFEAIRPVDGMVFLAEGETEQSALIDRETALKTVVLQREKATMQA